MNRRWTQSDGMNNEKWRDNSEKNGKKIRTKCDQRLKGNRNYTMASNIILTCQ